MIDAVLVVAFVALPIAIWRVTRSLTWTAISIAFAFAVGGDAVQSLVALGIDWNVRGLQALSLALLAAVLVVAVLRARSTSSWKRQWLAVGVPIAAIAAFLTAMRLLAPGDPGPLSAVGYLINHPQAEDNAKWLHLTAQLADGRDIAFSGYAGGPLLLMMSVVAALVSVLSLVMLGGLNEVAVAANTLVLTQFVLIAAVPVALAPLAESRVRLMGEPRKVPVILLWTGMFVLFVASAIVTSFGHLSLQFVLISCTLWAASFLVSAPGRLRLLATLTIAMSASVWLPLNVLGIVLLLACVVWTLRSRDWVGFGLTVVAGVVAWDAIMSSLLFLLGFSSSGENLSSDELGNVGSGLPDEIAVANSLFTAPGGVEKIAPIVGVLTLASLLFVVWLMSRSSDTSVKRAIAPFLPLAVLPGYVVAIQTLDAVSTAGAPHYGGHKLAYLAVVTALASTLPIALSGLSAEEGRLTLVQWFAVGGIVVALTVDTILPRAISALSPMLWPSISTESPQYWAAAEVRPTASQPLSSLPVVCLSAPPERSVPTALPLGQQSYACTRLLIGLAGLEGRSGLVTDWLQTDWASNRENWVQAYEALASTTGELRGRQVILMNAEGGLAGLTTFGQLLDRYRPIG